MPHLRRLTPLALTLAALASAAVAHADAPWSTPVDVPGASGYGTPLVVTRAGHAVLAAPVRPDVPGAPAGAVSEVVALGADGTPGRATGLGDAELQLATYGTDRIVVAGRTAHPVAGNPPAVTIDATSRVQVAFGTGAGDVGAPRTLAGTTGDQLYALAASPRGDVVVVTGDLRARTRTLWVRRPGGSFRVALTVSVGPLARGATAAVGPKGDLLLVWEDNHIISSRHVGPTGGLGKTYRVGDGVQSDLQAAIDGTGREYVAWKSQRVSEGEANSPAIVSYATAAPGHGFGAARRIESVGPTGAGRYVSSPGVRLVTGAGDATVLAWTGFDGTHYVARAATVEGGHVRAAQQLSPAGVDAVLGDLAVDPDGRAVALWRSNVAGADPSGAGHQRVWANVRATATAPFGAPEALSDPDRDVPDPPSAALDPTTHRALAAFAFVLPGTVGVTQRAPLG
jgi:hypothetical protein